MKRLKQLGDENGRLETIFADLTLDRAILQDVICRNILSLLSPVHASASGQRARMRELVRGKCSDCAVEQPRLSGLYRKLQNRYLSGGS
jgi:hypothetical protein